MKMEDLGWIFFPDQRCWRTAKTQHAHNGLSNDKTQHLKSKTHLPWQSWRPLYSWCASWWQWRGWTWWWPRWHWRQGHPGAPGGCRALRGRGCAPRTRTRWTPGAGRAGTGSTPTPGRAGGRISWQYKNMFFSGLKYKQEEFSLCGIEMQPRGAQSHQDVNEETLCTLPITCSKSPSVPSFVTNQT